jgi:predicted S18 family serine protease
MIYDMIYFLTAIGLTPGGSSTVHIYTQTVHRTTQSTQTIHRTTQSTQTIHRTTQFTNVEECGPCPIFASYALAFALQLRKKHGKTAVRVTRECQLAKINVVGFFLNNR